MSYYKFNENETPKPVVPKGTGARKGEGEMDEEEVQRIVGALISDAAELIDGELSQDRARATDYYFGEPFGNEEEGRSQVVLTEVRDTVLGTLPSLLRIIFGPERVIEAVARTERGVPIAKQATDYVQYVFAEDNQGFLQTDDVFKDGLIRRIGIFKWWWDDSSVTAHAEVDCTLERLQELGMREDVEFTKVEFDKENNFTGNVEYTVKDEGRARVSSVPPEEIIFSRNAKGLNVRGATKDTIFFGHRREVPRGDLLAMGIDEDLLEQYGQKDTRLDDNVERRERKANQSQAINTDPEAGEANDLVLLVEGYTLLDVDGDGTSELRYVRAIGPGYHVVDTIPADEIPFSIWTPYREPHTLVGLSQADLVMDIQLVKSSLVRGILDSLALSIYPRTAAVEGQVSIEDLLNNEIGAPIRVKREGAVQPFNHPFTGGDAMPIVSYFDDVSEGRTGRDKGQAGLDADALQSTTKDGVGAVVQASQEQVEMLARGFCEQALKPLFRGIYKLLVKHQPKARITKLRGQYVPVDVAQWDADMDFTVNVALGTSFVEQRIATLMGIKATQEQILQTLGPQNPLVTLAQYRETLARLVELGGYRDVSAFFQEVDPNWQPPQQPAPPPTPEQTMAQAQLQIEQMRTQKDLQIKQAELELKQRAQEFDHMLQVKKLANDFVLRRYQIDAQFKADFTQANLEADSAAEEAALNGALAIRKQVHTEDAAARQHELDAQAQAHDQALAQDQQAHEQNMDQQAQDTADQAAQAGPGTGE